MDLQQQINELKELITKGSFSSKDVFDKNVQFKGRIKLTPKASLPTTCEIGEITSYGGKLYHCSAANTWTAQT